MFKYFLTILLVISTCAVVAHGVLAYQFNAVQSLVDEKESSDDKPISKNAKDDGKEKILHFLDAHNSLLIKKEYLAVLNNCLKGSKGFFDKPYNPPE